MNGRSVRTVPALAMVLAMILSVGCGGRDRPDPRVGDMANVSYSGYRDDTLGTNAKGREVRITDHAGKFVWVDYAAPWCGPCTPQAGVIQAVERAFGDDVVFLTVLTSGHDVGVPTSPELARQWAKQFGLEPDHVIAGSEWGRVIPQHILFSPDGQTLFRETGLRDARYIQETLNRYREEWSDWKEYRAVARWMRNAD